MKRKIFAIIYILMFFCCYMYSDDIKTPTDTYIFIDISNSMTPLFSDVQDHIIENMIPSVPMNTHLQIFKFYGKMVPIFDGRTKTQTDINYAKKRVDALLSNGSWTDLENVFSYVADNNLNSDNSLIYILTDGHIELNDGQNYFLTADTLSDYIDNAEVEDNGSWLMIKWKSAEKIELVTADAGNTTPTVTDTVVVSNVPENLDKRNHINTAALIGVCIVIIMIFLLLILSDIITYRKWKEEKAKSIDLTQFKKYSNKRNKIFTFAIICFFMSLLVFAISLLCLGLMTVVCIIIAGIILGLSCVLFIKNIKTNKAHSIEIIEIYDKLRTPEYVDLSEKFGIESSVCNQILYLKRKKIEDKCFTYSISEKQQIVLGIALQRINDSNAIGIQKNKKFYYLNLEKIFEKLDVQLTEEKRKTIIKIINRLYGNDILDELDWALGASIGMISGLMDVFLVAKPGDSKLGDFVDKLTEKSVMLAAKISGYEGDKSDGAVKFLENKFYVPYDTANFKELGINTKNHHLYSLAHSDTAAGLICAIADVRISIAESKKRGGKLVSVVTCKYQASLDSNEVISNNPNIRIIIPGLLLQLIQPVKRLSGKDKGAEKDIADLANNVLFKFLYDKCKDADEYETIFFCVIYGFLLWLGHLYSDKIGSSETVKKGNRGTGIIASFLEIFASADFEINSKVTEHVEKRLKTVTEEMYKKGFDKRFFLAQKIPVAINEYMTKITFIIKEYVKYKKSFTVDEIISILMPERITKKHAIQNSSFELEKMLLISFSTFSIIDSSGAFITNRKDKEDILLSINYAGLIKLGKEAYCVFLSYFRRWTASPDKIIKKIEQLSQEILEQSEKEVLIE